MTKTYFQVLYDNGNGWPCGMSDGLCETEEEAEVVRGHKARQQPNLKYLIAKTEVPDGIQGH
jgi:hypothetical protein